MYLIGRRESGLAGMGRRSGKQQLPGDEPCRHLVSALCLAGQWEAGWQTRVNTSMGYTSTVVGLDKASTVQYSVYFAAV